jgi:pyruvate,water dikinase
MIREMGAMVRDMPEVVKRLAAADRRAVDATPEMRAAFDAYVAKFGDRCTQELKLESRTLHEDPAQVLMAIAAAAATRTPDKAAPEAAPELEDIIPQPGKRLLAGWLLKWARPACATGRICASSARACSVASAGSSWRWARG